MIEYRKILKRDEWIVAEHVLEGTPVLPGAAFVEMGIACAAEASGKSVRKVKSMAWLQPLMFGADEGEREIVIRVERDKTTQDLNFEICSVAQGKAEQVYSRGKIELADSAATQKTTQSIDLATIRSRLKSRLGPAEVYKLFYQAGLQYGASFKVVEELWSGAGESFARLALSAERKVDFSSYILHPTLLDGFFQATAGTSLPADLHSDSIWVPFALGEVELLRPLIASPYVHVKLLGGTSADLRKFELSVLDASGHVLVALSEFAIRKIPKSLVKGILGSSKAVPKAAFQNTAHTAPFIAPPTAPMTTSKDLRAVIETDIVGEVCAVLKFEPSDVDVQANLMEFGFDSITVTTLTAKLNEKLGLELTAAVFFEVTTIRAFVEYLQKEHSTAIQAHYAQRPAASAAVSAAPIATVTPSAPKPAPSVRRSLTAAVIEADIVDEVCEVLKFDAKDVDVEANLTEFGFDSITVTTLTSKLNDKLGLELTPAVFFEVTSIRGFAAYLQKEHTQAIEAHYDVAPVAAAPVAAVPSAPATPAAPKPAPAVSRPLTAAVIEADIVGQVCEVLKFEAKDVDVQANLTEFGFDSITVTTLTSKLNEKLGLDLTPAVFFEVTTIRSFVAYLQKEHARALAVHYGQAEKKKGSESPLIRLREHWAAVGAVTTEVSSVQSLLVVEDEKGSSMFPDAIRVRFGSEFKKTSARAYEVSSRGGDVDKLLAALEKDGALPKTILHLAACNDRVELSAATELDEGVLFLFELCKKLLAKKVRDFAIVVASTQVPGARLRPLVEGLGGFGGALIQEAPKARFKSVVWHGSDAIPESILTTELAAFSKPFTTVRYVNGVREVRGLEVLNMNAAPVAGEWTPTGKGVFLITGGAGELGLFFAENLARQQKDTTVILCGRSDLTKERQVRMRGICERTSAKVEYVKTDVSNPAELNKLVSDIRRQHGALTGVIHSAGVLRDSAIENKERADFEQVLSPKIHGTKNLIAALKGESLDFFALFSSVSGLLGNRGQTDYSFANACLNGYARRAKQELKVKNAVSLVWPLWSEGGMLPNEAGLKMQQALGFTPLEKDEGWAEFKCALASGHSQWIVLKGDRAKIVRLFGHMIEVC